MNFEGAGAGVGFGTSFGGSGVFILALVLADLLRVGLEAKGFAEEEKEGERLVLSRKASDQVKPSPVETVSIDS